MRSWLVGALLFLYGTSVEASSAGPFVVDIVELAWTVPPTLAAAHPDTLTEKEPERWVAAGIALLVGPFGAHRLYFGTTAKVPIIYGITLGGFGILVLIDIGHILATKDLSPYRHNDKVFMWAKPKAPTTPP